MTTTAKPLTSSRDMLTWQYKSLLGELQQIELHAESGDCPCIMGDLAPAEFCLAKHTLNVHTLAFETANMDSANAKILRQLADEAIEKHNGVKAFVCHKEKLPVLSEWARDWRKKHVERIYYTCKVRAKMHQDGKEFCHFAAGIGPNAAQTLLQAGSTPRQMIAAMCRVHIDPRQTSMDKWLEEATKAPAGTPLTPEPLRLPPAPCGRTSCGGTSSSGLLTAQKLRAAADAMEKQIEHHIHPSIADQIPTARRSRIAGGMYEEGERLQKIQRALRGLADCHEAGSCPPMLAGIRTKKQIEDIQLHTHFPHLYIGKYALEGMKEHTKGVPEAAPLVAILDAARAREPGEYSWSLTEDEMRAAEKLLAISEKHGNTDSHRMREAWGHYNRLASIGIKDDETFQTVKRALDDLVSGTPIVKPKDVIQRELEAKLIGLRIPGFFTTPHELAARMVAIADIRMGMSILEPSAGSGNIADAIKAACPMCPLTLVEYHQTLLEILRAKGYEPIAGDFMEHTGSYDRVVMNPPFEHGQDVDHVLHAYKLLKPGGRLVAIMGAHAFFAGDKKSEAFRLWLEEANGGTSEELPSGTFEHQATSTGAAARLIVVDKVGAGMEQPRGMTKAQWEEAVKHQLPMDFDTAPGVAVPTTCPPVCDRPTERSAEAPERTPAPVKKFELFPFQKEGVDWLKTKSRALLADDMGLGKTPQAIHWGSDHLPALVVVPAALLWNWHREITTMWRPGDSVVVLEGKTPVPRPLPQWTILTYGMLDHYLKQLKQAGFQSIIIDEAHMVKNLEAQRTRHLLDLVDPLEPTDFDKPIPNRLAVTGTPILNRPIELFALLVFLGEKHRGDFQDFLKRYTDHKYVKGRLIFTGARNLYELNQSLKDIMIRRMKVDVLKNLPPKTHTAMFVPITNAAEYREAETHFLKWLRESQGDAAAKTAARAQMLTKMNALRQLAAAGKVGPVCDWLKPCYQGTGKVIIFSSFSEPLEDLKNCSGDAEIYDGSVDKRERQAIVDKFQKTTEPCHFLGTVGAAGVGITLTAASRVAFLDLPWTPGAKLQAEDRAYRIGQTKAVEIVNVLARGTIDERMLKLLADKEFIIAQAVDGKRIEDAKAESISGALMDDFMRHPVLSGLMQYEPEAKDKGVDFITEDDLRVLQGDLRQAHVHQNPQVTISGKCKGKESCTLKVKASESVEAVSSIGGLTKSIDDVLKRIEETHAPPPSAVTFAIGSTTLTRYEFQNKLVEAGSLLASHNPITFEATPNYPPELQPRLRGRAANRSQVQNIAKNLDPDALLSDFHSIDRGAPIVGQDNVVESGNGRVMAIQLAVELFPEAYAKYRDELMARATASGVSEDEARSMKAPVLVRVRLTDVPRRQFVEEANASTTLAPSAIEVARADASHLTLEMVQQLWVGEEQGIEDALRSLANGQFVSAFLATIPANQRAQITDAKGQLNQDGIRRMVMALFVHAFPGDSGLRLAEKFFESTEPSVRNVFNGIAQALGKLAKAEGLCRSNARDPELMIGEDIAAAVSVFAEIKKTPGMTVANYLGQAQMFERRLNPFQERLLRLIDERARSGKKIGQLLKSYAAIVMESTPPAQGSLIPGVQLTKDQALDAALQRAQAEPELAPAMFQAQPKVSATHCSALAGAVKTLQAAAKSLQTYRSNLVKAGGKLQTSMNICRGQGVMFQQAVEVDPDGLKRVEGKTYRLFNKALNQWRDITAETPDIALAHLGWKAEDVTISKVWKSSGKVGTSGQIGIGWSKLVIGTPIAPDKGAHKISKAGKAPIVKISGKCGDKAESCTFTLKRQQKAIKAKGVDEALAAIDKLSKPCACAEMKQEQELSPIEGSLLNSMMEEHMAVQAYIQRGGEAARAGDMKTALLYRHIATEEGKHYDEFGKRLEAKEGTAMEQTAKMSICPACLLALANEKKTKKPVCSPAQAEKREQCIQDMKEANREKGCCKAEGNGSKTCPSVFAVCTTAVGCRASRN